MNSDGPSTNRDKSPSTSVVPLCFWLSFQCAAIRFCDAGWPLTSSWPDDPRASAAQLFVAGQVALLGVTFPYLLRSLASTAVTVATAAPFIALAARDSKVPLDIQAANLAFFAAWALSLWLWARYAHRRRETLIATAIGGLFTLGLPACGYLALEFGATGLSLAGWHPVAAVAASDSFHLPPLAAWLFLGGILGLGATANALDRMRSNVAPAK